MFEKITRLYHVICKQWRSRTIVSGFPLPLPTTDDIEELGVKDAGIYMISLRRESPVTYKQFILDKRGNWYGPPKEHIWCCVDHLLTYLTRLVELNSSGEKDLSLSHSEVQQFAKARKKGIELRLEDKEGNLGVVGIAILPKKSTCP